MNPLALAVRPLPVTAALPGGRRPDPMLCKHGTTRTPSRCDPGVIASAPLLLDGFLVKVGDLREAASAPKQSKTSMDIDVEMGENRVKIARTHLFWLRKIA